jgi:hypothetical protein
MSGLLAKLVLSWLLVGGAYLGGCAGAAGVV